MTDEYTPDELLCPCGHPLSKHTSWGGGCFAVTNSPKVGDQCECMVSSDSLQDLEEPLRKLAAYEDKRNYAPMRNLANAAADVLACWNLDDRDDFDASYQVELDHFMGALKRALENYKG